MIRLAFLVLVIDLTIGQLNYEGNPFTEYTEYVAEESNLSERSARQNDVSPTNPSNSEMSPPPRPQKLYPVVNSENDKNLQDNNNLISDKPQEQLFVSVQSFQPDTEDTSARQFQQTSSHQNAPITPARIALNTFLNSKTPEESRASLDQYLRSQQLLPDDQSRSLDASASQNTRSMERQFVNHQQPQISQISQIEQQKPVMAPQEMRLTSQVGQSQLASQLIPHQTEHQLLPSPEQVYHLSYDQQPPPIQPVIKAPAGVQIVRQGMLQPVPFMSGFQPRSDLITPAMWRERRKRIHGKPFPFAQSRIAPGFYKGPVVGECQSRFI